MNEYEEKKTIRDALNRSLSGLDGNPQLAQQMIEGTKGEKRVMKKKLSVGFVLAMVALFATVTALAVGLVFSPRYDAKRLANEALADQYGITDEMMTIFIRSDTGDQTDGSRVFTYQAVEDLYAKQIGIYTVTVKDGMAVAVWSHDGEDTSGGFKADAWGASQIALLCSDRYGEACAELSGNPAVSSTPPTAPPEKGDAAVSASEVAEAEADFQAQQAAWEESKKQVEAVSKLSLEDAYGLAVSGVQGEYGLSAAQCEQFVFYDDLYGVTYRFEDNQPVVDLFLHLSQAEDGTYTEKDGIYVVTVNMVDGVIEDMIYDSGLAANQ